MNENQKMNLEIDDIEKMEVDDMVAMIDNMMESGVGRLKVKSSDTVEPGSFRKEYHHGRCDINSPFAKGTAFDVLEDK